ncbi:MAG TPA: hypothetical protein VHU90_11700 [Galbitalea sp.]|jgi:hypothetical protein|nr:hypothetical protein [Galbitalea sp.]
MIDGQPETFTTQRTSRRLPGAVADALRRARTLENLATGANRRRAWQVTRELIQATLSAGYPATFIANALGVTSGSIRNRAGGSGFLDAIELLELADLSTATLDQWEIDGLLPHTKFDGIDRRMYAAEDIILGLARQDSIR